MSFGPNQLNSAAEQLDAKIAELEAVISSATNDAQARVSRDLKKAWESVYNALGYSPNPRGPGAHAHMSTAHSSNRPSTTATLVASAMGAGQHSHATAPNVPLEPGEASTRSAVQNGQIEPNKIGVRNECSNCKGAASDVLWVCISCADHRLCNTCKNDGRKEMAGKQHRLVAWAIDKTTIAKGHYIVCDDCSKPVVGLRWSCAECESFDVCNDCAKSSSHQHELKSMYFAETASFPYGAVGYSCNLCGSTATPPVYCCLHCKDFHVCGKCVVSDRISEHDHDYAALCIPATALAPARAPAPAKKEAEVAAGDKAADVAAEKQGEGSAGKQALVSDDVAAVVCDGCEQSITGIRHKCTRCKNYDLCDGCFRKVSEVHPGHGFVHFGPPAHPPHHHRRHGPKRHGKDGFHHAHHHGHHHGHRHGSFHDLHQKRIQDHQEAVMKHQKDIEEHQAAVLNHFKTTPHVPPFPGRPGHHRHDFRCPPGQSPGSLVMPPPPMTCQFSPPAHPPPPSKVGRLQMLGGRWGHGWDHSFIPPPAPPAPLICSLPPPVPTPLNCNMPLPPPPVVNCNMPPLPVPVGECLTNDAAKARRHGLAISNEKQQQTDGASSAERSTSTDPASVQVVHPGVLCDSCGDLVMGVRYKCGNCRDFDLCEKCEAKTTHDASHMFIKIRNPCKVPIRVPMLSQVYEPLKLHINSPRGAAAENVPSMPSTAKEAAAKWDQFLAGVATAAAATKGKLVGEVARASTSAEPAEDKQPEPATAAEAPQVNETTKYAAHFVEDVTIPDGTAVGAGEPFVKIWSVANMSEYEWPQGTMLVHMDGEPTIPGRKKAVAVIVGKRYEQIGVAVDLVAPEKPGKYISKWRLMTPTGQYFGSGLWCSIAVPEDASASPAVDSVPQLAICPAKPEDIGTSPDIDSFPRLAICPAKPEDKGKEVETASEASSALVSVSASISASETSSSKSVSDIVSVLSSKPASVAASADDEEDAVVVDVVAESEVAAKTEEAVDERAVPELTKTKSMSVAPSEALSTSESIASLTNTFVQISADLMKEIQRLDSSIKEIQAKQSANENKQPFDITSAPNLSSETPIKSYPTATPPRTFTNVDLLTSPPITFAQTHPLVQPSAPPMIGTSRHASAPDAMSEHSSVREFLASTDRLDRLVGSTRQSDPVSPFYTHSGSPAGGNPFHQSASDNGHDEFEFVNDFTPHFAKHNHHHNH